MEKIYKSRMCFYYSEMPYGGTKHNEICFLIDACTEDINKIIEDNSFIISFRKLNRLKLNYVEDIIIENMYDTFIKANIDTFCFLPDEPYFGFALSSGVVNAIAEDWHDALSKHFVLSNIYVL